MNLGLTLFLPPTRRASCRGFCECFYVLRHSYSHQATIRRGFGSSNSSGASTPFITSGPATPQIEAFGDKGDELSAHVSEKLRQATISKATLAAPPPVRSSESTDLSKEHSEKGQVKTHVYTEYIKAASRIGFIFFMLAIIGQQAASVAATLSLRQWGEHNREAGGNTNIWWFLGIYGILSLTQTLLGGTASLMMQVFCSLRSARKLHDSVRPPLENSCFPNYFPDVRFLDASTFELF